MAKDPAEFAGLARYIGSMPKDDQMCDFYEVEMDGNISYVYVPIGQDEEVKAP